jgi:hypothetical protein
MINFDGGESTEARRRLSAANQIVLFERERSINLAATDNIQLGDGDDDEILESDISEFLHQSELIDHMLGSTPEQAAEEAVVLLDDFLGNEQVRNATLAFINMKGEWPRADDVELMLLEAAELLRGHGYDRIHIPERDSPAAKRRMMMQPGLVAEDGMAAIWMKRLLLEASGPGKRTVQIDKVTSHVAWMARIPELASRAPLELARRALAAGHEMRLIILTSRLMGMNYDQLRGLVYPDLLDDREALRQVLPPDVFEETPVYSYDDPRSELLKLADLAAEMEAYDISKGEIIHRSQIPNFANILNWENHLYLLGVMRRGKDGGELFTPATTRFFAHYVNDDTSSSAPVSL